MVFSLSVGNPQRGQILLGLCVHYQRLLRVRANIVLVVIEVGVLNAVEQLLSLVLGRLIRHSGCGVHENADTGRGGRGPARSGGRQNVNGIGVGKDSLAPGLVDLAQSRGDLHVVGVFHSPTQSCTAAFVDGSGRSGKQRYHGFLRGAGFGLLHRGRGCRLYGYLL